MSLRPPVLVVGILLAACFVASAFGSESPATRKASAAPVSDAQVRAAIQRSLPLLEAGGVAWMENKSCISCHHVPFLLWSHTLAQSRGVAVDSIKLNEWIEWTAAKSLEDRGPFSFTREALVKLGEEGLSSTTVAALRSLSDKTFRSQPELVAALKTHLPPAEVEKHTATVMRRTWPASRPASTNGGGLDTLVQLALGRPGNAPASEAATPQWSSFLATTPDLIVAWQEPQGYWKAAGQLPNQNRSKAESDAVSTRWALLALASLPKSPAGSDAIERALRSVSEAKDFRSTESIVTALLLAHRLGGKAGDEGEWLSQLLRRQNSDGGWAWLEGGNTDAFATGQALYALATTGSPSAATAIERGRAYLLAAQEPDGGWPADGAGITNAKSSPARLKKVAPIYRYWSSAWATIGLTQSLLESPAKKP